MAYTAPFTAVPGAVVKSSDWNTSGRDDISFLYNVLTGAQLQAVHFLSTLQVDGAATFGGGISGATVIDGVTVAPAMTGITSIDGTPFPIQYTTLSGSASVNSTPVNIINAAALPSTGEWLIVGWAACTGGTEPATQQVTITDPGAQNTYMRYDQSVHSSCPIACIIGGSSVTVSAVGTNASNGITVSVRLQAIRHNN